MPLMARPGANLQAVETERGIRAAAAQRQAELSPCRARARHRGGVLEHARARRPHICIRGSAELDPKLIPNAKPPYSTTARGNIRLTEEDPDAELRANPHSNVRAPPHQRAIAYRVPGGATREKTWRPCLPGRRRPSLLPCLLRIRSWPRRRQPTRRREAGRGPPEKPPLKVPRR